MEIYSGYLARSDDLTISKDTRQWRSFNKENTKHELHGGYTDDDEADHDDEVDHEISFCQRRWSGDLDTEASWTIIC